MSTTLISVSEYKIQTKGYLKKRGGGLNTGCDTGGYWCIQVKYGVLCHLIHSSCNRDLISDKLVGCPSRRTKWSQTCSIGNKSVDRVRQGKIVVCRRHTLAMCGRALSYWKMLAGSRHFSTGTAWTFTAGMSRCCRWILGDRVSCDGTPHRVGAMRRCKAKAGLRCLPRGLHTRKKLSSLPRLNLDSSLKTIWFHLIAVQSRRARHHSKRKRLWASSTRNGRRDTKCASERRFALVVTDTEVCSEGATCVWLVDTDEVGSTHAWRIMLHSFLLSVWRGRPEPGRSVCDLSLIYWSQHLKVE